MGVLGKRDELFLTPTVRHDMRRRLRNEERGQFTGPTVQWYRTCELPSLPDERAEHVQSAVGWQGGK